MPTKTQRRQRNSPRNPPPRIPARTLNQPPLRLHRLHRLARPVRPHHPHPRRRLPRVRLPAPLPAQVQRRHALPQPGTVHDRRLRGQDVPGRAPDPPHGHAHRTDAGNATGHSARIDGFRRWVGSDQPGRDHDRARAREHVRRGLDEGRVRLRVRRRSAAATDHVGLSFRVFSEMI
uniref:(northern house mosquito) hypothetical protein n=1 Tax=Culex pipiens TaxID=7175 RepID=A0A8D8H691_CULPI